MAIDFGDNNSTKRYTIADSADLTFPNSDWFMAFWTRVDDNSGSNFQYIISNNNFQVANSINIFLGESSSSVANVWRVTTDTQAFSAASTPGADGKDRLIVVQRNSGNLQIYFCEAGQAASQEHNSTYSDGAIDGGTLFYGCRKDLNTSRFYEEHVGDFFKGSVALTAAQITMLGAGISPPDAVGFDNLDFWLPFREATSTVKDMIGSNDATRVNTPVTSEHFITVSSANIATITASGSGAQDISPTGIASAEAFGTTVITTGAVDIAPTGIGSAEAFGTAVVTSTVDVSPTSIGSAEAFGTATLTTGAVDVSPTGIGSAEAFGTPVITQDAQIISPNGIASAESFGTTVVTVGVVDISPTGFASSEAFGTLVVAVGAQNISPNGIASVEAFGTAVLTTGAVDISLTGISSEESFGTATVALPAAKAIQIEGQDELVINTNLGSTTLYFNGKDYFSI